MNDEPDINPAAGLCNVRRMAWPNAIVAIAMASLVCWLVVIGVYLGVTPDEGIVADERDIQEILEFAPAAGPTK